jgi:hypothetical protein
MKLAHGSLLKRDIYEAFYKLNTSTSLLTQLLLLAEHKFLGYIFKKGYSQCDGYVISGLL